MMPDYDWKVTHCSCNFAQCNSGKMISSDKKFTNYGLIYTCLDKDWNIVPSAFGDLFMERRKVLWSVFILKILKLFRFCFVVARVT